MLGEAFHRVFKNDYEIKCTDKDVNEQWLSFLDFRDFEKYFQTIRVKAEQKVTKREINGPESGAVRPSLG